MVHFSNNSLTISLSIYEGGIMLNEKKPRLSLTGAIVILSICILLSAFIISSAIRNSIETDHGTYEYELQRFNDNFEELIKTLQENNEVGQ
jgi:hypothetical protein